MQLSDVLIASTLEGILNSNELLTNKQIKAIQKAIEIIQSIE